MKIAHSNKDLSKALEGFRIVVDTRERINGHLTEWFDRHNIAYEIRKLDHGDYSCMVGDKDLGDHISIERKHNLNEICGNFGVNRDRFEREFERYKAAGTKPFLIIENASWADVFLHNYSSKLPVKALLASFFTWQIRYNITIIFCRQSDTAKMVYGILYYYAREMIKDGI